MNTPIKFIAPVEITAATAKGPRRFTTTAYTGAALRISGYPLPVVIDLAGLTTRKSVTANLDHDPAKRVGHIDNVQNDGQKLLLSGSVSAANAAAQEFVQAHDNGYPWQASVEVSPEQLEQIAAGESIQANGRKFDGPLYITREGVLSAVAFVPNGADDNTHVSIAAQQRRNKHMKTSTDFYSWAASMLPGGTLADMTEEQLASLHANYEGRNEPIDSDFAATAPMIHASSDSVQREGKRLRQIEAACVGEWGDHSSDINTLKAQAIGGELSVDQLIEHMRKVRYDMAFDKLRECPPQPRFNPDAENQVIECAICRDGGLTNLEKHYSEQTLDRAYRMRNSVSLQQMLMAAAVGNGYYATAGERVTQGNLRRVLQAAFMPEIRGAGFSTVSLPTTLSNVANKFLRDGFDSVDQTALRICFIRSVKDFKQITTVSLTGAMQFLPVGPGGEIKHGTIGEEVYTNKADTYGLMFTLTRTDLINDDTDSLTAIPKRIGRGGMLKLNDLVWRLFLDNGSFFTALRNNLNTGVADMTLGGLEATETMFINQTDPDGNPLGIMPAILLVPPAQKAAALTLMNSQTVVGGSSTTPSANIWQSRFRVESSPYMQNAAYTGNSSVAWYLLASPDQLPVLEIAALNGNVQPTVETAEADFSTLGVQMRGFSDVGVALQEYRAGVRADGGSS